MGLIGNSDPMRREFWMVYGGAAPSGSKSPARKAASAMIAKIPAPLARHIGEVYWPLEAAV